MLPQRRNRKSPLSPHFPTPFNIPGYRHAVTVHKSAHTTQTRHTLLRCVVSAFHAARPGGTVPQTPSNTEVMHAHHKHARFTLSSVAQLCKLLARCGDALLCVVIIARIRAHGSTRFTIMVIVMHPQIGYNTSLQISFVTHSRTQSPRAQACLPVRFSHIRSSGWDRE